MNAAPKDSNPLVEAMESLQFELAQCRRELDACRERLTQMEGVFGHVVDAIFVAEPDGRIVDANPAACEFLGYSKAELLGRYPWDFVVSASHEEIDDLISSMKPDTAYTVQRTYRCRSGEMKIVDLRLIRCDLAQRKMIVASFRDVTAQRRLEERLRRNERNLAEGQRLTKTGSWILDFKTGETDWSVETCRIFGFPDPPPSPHYSEFRARVREEDREAVDRGLRESFETGEPRPLKYVFVLPDGVRKHIETISQPVIGEQGERMLMGTVMDITERVAAEEALRKSEANLRTVLDTIPGLVWSAKPDGFVEYHNRTWLDYTGLTPEEARGWGWRAAIHPDDLPGLESTWKALLGSGKEGQGEARFRRFDGQYRWFLFRGVPLHDTTGKLVKWYGANTDIEDLKQTAGALRASERFARGQTEALTEALDALARESSVDRIVEHVLQTIIAQLKAHSCSVWLKDEGSDLMNFEFALEGGLFQTKADATLAAVSPSRGVEDIWPWPEIFRTGKPYVLEDIREAPVPDFPWRAHVLALGVVCILIVPMLIAGKVRGVIGIRFSQTRAFRSDEIELAQALAHQAMLAMQLSRIAAQSRQTAVLAERNRLARDIHDTLAQGFAGVIVQLEAAADANSKRLTREAKEHLNRAGNLARESLNEARRSVRALRPRALEKQDLCEALYHLIREMTMGTVLRAEFKVIGVPLPLPADWEENLLRIGQEILTNSMRHAQASEFKAQLLFAPDEIRLEVRDNGQGFDAAIRHDGFGLLGIRERVEGMGGQLTIESAAKKGTAITIVLPLAKISQAPQA